jgi:hypothetical protein
MTFTSRIARVWVLLWWNGPVGLSFICKRLLIVESWGNIASDNRFYLYTGHKFYVHYQTTWVTFRNPPSSKISGLPVSKEGSRILRLRVGSCISLQRELQLWVPTSGGISLLGDKDRVSLSLSLKFWVSVTSLRVWESIGCLLSSIHKICLSFRILVFSSSAY